MTVRNIYDLFYYEIESCSVAWLAVNLFMAARKSVAPKLTSDCFGGFILFLGRCDDYLSHESGLVTPPNLLSLSYLS